MTSLRRILSAAVLTLLVAAPTAFAGAGASVVYVDDADGNPNDCPATTHQTLNQGIDAVSPGGTVEVCPGTYEATLTVDNDDRPVVDKSLTISGPNDTVVGNGARGPEAIITRTGGDRANFNRDFGIIVAGNVDDVTITGLSFTGALDAGVQFEDPGNIGGDADAFDIDVINNRFVGIQGSAFISSIPQATTRRGWNVEGNYVADWTRTNETAFFLSSGSNNGTVVTGNIVDGNPAVAGSRGLNLDGAIDNTVADNTFRELTRYGVQLANSADGVDIFDNAFTSVNQGVRLRTGHTPAGQPGALRSVRIDANTFTDVTANAVASDALQPNGSLRDLEITGNVVDQDAAAIVESGAMFELYYDQGASNGPTRISDNAVTIDGTLSPALATFGIELYGDAGTVEILRNTLDGVSGGVAGAAGSAGVRLSIITPVGDILGDIEITGNAITGWRNGIAIVDEFDDTPSAALNATITATLNRIVGNAAGFTASGPGAGTTAERNWWGCNTGPNTAGCDTVTGGIDFNPWLVLDLVAEPAEIPADGGVSLLRADVSQDSAGNAVDTTQFPTSTLGFTTTLGTVTPLDTLEAGVADGRLTATGTAGTAKVEAIFDNARVARDVVIKPRAVTVQTQTQTQTPAQQAATPAPAAEDAPPRVRLVAPAPAGRRLSTSRPTPLSAVAEDDRGVAAVTFVVNDRALCRDTAAPYECSYRPTGGDVGRATIVAIATDTAGQTGTDVRGFFHARFSPTRLTLNVRGATATGRLSLRPGVSRAVGCNGQVRLTQRYQDPESGRRVLTTQRATLRDDCTYRRVIKVPGDRKRITVTARFLGNKVVAPATSRSRTVRAG